MTEDRPHWQGDLEDDCVLNWMGCQAHVEKLYEGCWYCSVWVPGKDLFHSTEDEVNPGSGPAARRLCEMVIRLAAAGVNWRDA